MPDPRRRHVHRDRRGSRRGSHRPASITVDATGIALESGEHLDADIIVTATGLQLQALGGIAFSLDACRSSPATASSTRRTCSTTCPTCSGASGYTNASWTLRADMTARATAKLLAHMASHGYTHACPHLGGQPMDREADLGHRRPDYVQRPPHALPKSGTNRPWNVRQNYVPTPSTTGSTASRSRWCWPPSDRAPVPG